MDVADAGKVAGRGSAPGATRTVVLATSTAIALGGLGVLFDMGPSSRCSACWPWRSCSLSIPRLRLRQGLLVCAVAAATALLTVLCTSVLVIAVSSGGEVPWRAWAFPYRLPCSSGPSWPEVDIELYYGIPEDRSRGEDQSATYCRSNYSNEYWAILSCEQLAAR